MSINEANLLRRIADQDLEIKRLKKALAPSDAGHECGVCGRTDEAPHCPGCGDCLAALSALPEDVKDVFLGYPEFRAALSAPHPDPEPREALRGAVLRAGTRLTEDHGESCDCSTCLVVQPLVDVALGADSSAIDVDKLAQAMAAVEGDFVGKASLWTIRAQEIIKRYNDL